MHTIRDQRALRRVFLRSAAALSAAPWVIPASALGAERQPAPSNRITLGFIGVGCMGRGHLWHFLQHPETQVLAVCDVDTWRRDDAQATVEKAYAAERTRGTYRGCAAYVDLRELLAREDVDAAVIVTGDRWHAAATVMAVRAGKDVYVEKPLCLTIAEGRVMVEAVRRYGRVCQVGLQQRSAREFRIACQLVRDGALGKIDRIYTIFSNPSTEIDLPAEPTPPTLQWDLWLGPAPWRPFNSRFHYLGRPLNVVPWEFCRDFGNGGISSGGVHAFDVVQWALGMDRSGPVEIIPPETGQYPDLTFKYPGGVLLHVVDGRLDARRHSIPKGWDPITSIQPFGAVFVGERGWIHVGRGGYLVSCPAEIVRELPGRYDHLLAVESHHGNFLESIRTRRRPACDVSIGCQSTIVPLLGCIARWTGRALKWDPVGEQFLGDDQANRMRRRAMREPWRV
jgi:predicted dehydrogenase